ncbi:hypothetical protein [Actinokineospora sp.]|uniref:hypothetical protein n=1 Tax=Actinokineospora sp. TaxID=1872133 RepID=UPI00403833A4
MTLDVAVGLALVVVVVVEDAVVVVTGGVVVVGVLIVVVGRIGGFGAGLPAMGLQPDTNTTAPTATPAAIAILRIRVLPPWRLPNSADG